MKILFFDCWIHPKNLHGFKLMCDSIKAELVISNDIDNISKDWDIVYIPSTFFEPEYFVNTKHIIYGPHAFLFPQQIWQIYSFDSRCKYLLPSQWTKEFLNETGGINLPIITNPFAVDVEYFKPKDVSKKYECILYTKHRKPEHIEYVELLLKEKKIKYCKFDYLEKYKEEDYIQAINESNFMIMVASTESQGFALEECLSMNVPILVWNATSLFDEINSFGKQTYNEYLGKYKLKGTTIPYWDERCGISFTEKKDFETSLEKMRISYTQFHPRDYVLENLSPSVCMQKLLQNLGTPT